MENYIATARTNYVEIEDMEGLMKALEPFEIVVSGIKLRCLLADGEGGWPSIGYDKDDREIEFSFEEIVMPYVKEGDCLIAMEVGAEKLRFVLGYAEAFVRRGDKVASTQISLGKIYQMAQEELGCENITQAEY